MVKLKLAAFLLFLKSSNGLELEQWGRMDRPNYELLESAPAAQKLIGPLNNSIETNCSSKRNLYSGRRNIDRWVDGSPCGLLPARGISSVCGFDREIYVRQIRNR